MSSSKKYGLIVPGKAKTQKPGFQAAKNVFGNESDSDEEGKKPVLLKPSENINRQAKISQEKAVMEDPTVYQYDEIYDSMSSQKEEKKAQAKEEKKPRYIENLLKAANKRKIENERRMERKIQLERENEGEEFADKEVFVTSAYKQKLEELRKEEEKEKREEYLESIGDVTKQKDLGGFYRHLYEQKLGSDKTLKENQKSPEKEKASKANLETTEKDESIKKIESKRNYRKRHADTKDLSDGEIDESEEEINRVNLEDIRAKKLKQVEENIDADSDFSIDSTDSEDESGSEKKKKKNKNHSSKQEVMKAPIVKDVDDSTTTNDAKKVEKPVESDKENTPTPPPEPKPKVDIWKKRTVGDVFDEALKRYYERKAARGL